MDQRPLRIVHLVQTKLKIDRIPVQCDVFEARAYYFHGILQALRNNLRLQLSQCLDILIDGDQLFIRAAGSSNCRPAAPMKSTILPAKS